MKRYWIFSTLCIVVLMTGLLAFASNGNHLNNSEQSEKQDIASTESQVEMPNDNPMTASPVGMLDNNNDFACNLFRTINEQKGGGKSTIVSPISVSYVLGMLNEGADGETRRQITDVLGLGGTVQEINEYFKKMMHKAQSVDPSVTLKTANSIFVVSGKRLIPQYKADMQNYYDAQVEAINFNSGNIVNKINNWCKVHTDGMIPEILEKGELNPNRLMYLLNAVYFKASWTDQFDPRSTRGLDFITHDGKTVKRPMMHREGMAAYGKNDLCKMLCLPYGNKAYSMVVLLPNEGKTTDDIIWNLSAQKLKEWQSQMRTQDVDILMPRFTTESETRLEDILSSMGMQRAFNNAAEFPNMLKGYHDELYVSMMKQKAKIEVNEEGTKAAATTVAEMAEIGVVFYKYFYATRPFVYYIVEKSTGSIYFMGTYCFDENGEPVTIKEPLEEREIELNRPIGNGVKQNDVKRKENEIFKSVEQMPQFPGGEAALMEYIESHIQWPPRAACAQGRVIVQFVVDKTGEIGEVKVVRSVDKDLDEEAVRIVKTLPKFIPGRQNGRAVSVWYTLPVTFKLSSVRQK
jgi:serpin B